ncbi:MAG: FAD-dependent oxidoreductase, partial [Bacteroidota bacterium]
MKTITKSDVLIVGAGLTGLCIAYLLRKSGHEVIIIEARPRIGGRIHTIHYADGGSIEMGATWLGKKHQLLRALLAELGLATFEQLLGEKAIYEPISTSPPQLVQLPHNDAPSYRIQGGSSALINTLTRHIDAEQIRLNQVVQSIREVG